MTLYCLYSLGLFVPGIGKDEVRNNVWDIADVEGSSPIPDLTIYNGHALMLAHVLRLDFDNKGPM